MPTFAFSYLRLSKPEQIKGDSQRRQLAASRAYASEHGLVMKDELSDPGISAWKGRNRSNGNAFGKFIAAVDADRVPRGSTLIVESLDRLSREAPHKALVPFLDLVNKGIRIVTLSDKQTYDADRLEREPMALMMSLVSMMRANEESTMKSERVGAAWRKKHDDARAKKPITAKCPGWLVLGPDRKFHVIKEKADAVRRAFEWTAKGIGRAKVAQMLKERGVPALGGKHWYVSSLARLLKSDAPLGTYQPYEVKDGRRTPRGEPIEGYYPAIVKKDVVLKARAEMEARKTGFAGRKGEYLTNLFAGLVFCGQCGARMRVRGRGARRKGDRALVCSNVVERRGNCDHRRQYQLKKFERAFLSRVGEIDLKALDADRGGAIETLEDEANKLAAEHKKAQAKLRAAYTVFGPNSPRALALNISETAALVERLDKQWTAARQRLAQAKATQTSAEDRIALIERLRRKLNETSGDELFALRAHLAQEIRAVVDSIHFASIPTTVSLDNSEPLAALTEVRMKTGRGGFLGYLFAYDRTGGRFAMIPRELTPHLRRATKDLFAMLLEDGAIARKAGYFDKPKKKGAKDG